MFNLAFCYISCHKCNLEVLDFKNIFKGIKFEIISLYELTFIKRFKGGVTSVCSELGTHQTPSPKPVGAWGRFGYKNIPIRASSGGCLKIPGGAMVSDPSPNRVYYWIKVKSKNLVGWFYEQEFGLKIWLATCWNKEKLVVKKMMNWISSSGLVAIHRTFMLANRYDHHDFLCMIIKLVSAILYSYVFFANLIKLPMQKIIFTN